MCGHRRTGHGDLYPSPIKNQILNRVRSWYSAHRKGSYECYSQVKYHQNRCWSIFESGRSYNQIVMNGRKGENKTVHGVKTETLFRIEMDGINEHLRVNVYSSEY